MSAAETLIAGKNMKIGIAPAVILWNPKHAHNVGGVLRTASSFGIRQVWFSGERVSLDPKRGERLPREERMKGYKEVDLRQHDYPFDCFADNVQPVAVEVRPDAVPLPYFAHPEHATYVFGPEDGSIDGTVMRHCHHRIIIPTRHCLNLSVAVGVVLAHRQLQMFERGLDTDLPTPGQYEERGPAAGAGDLFDRSGAWDGSDR